MQIPSSSSNVKDGVAYWEKNAADVNDVDEKFSNARDLGYLRLNYSRVTAIAQLSNHDKEDNYKIQVQSNGKLSLSVRNTNGSDDKVLDLSKYEEELNKLKQMTDPEGYKKEQETKKKKLEEDGLLSTTAPGMQIQVYTIKNGREVLVADSTAEAGSEERANLDKMLQGDYDAKKGDYYVKVSRDDTVGSDEEIPYAVQMHVGDTFKHDYAFTETASSDTKNKTYTRVPSLTDYTSSTLSSVNALQIQATRYQATAQMLQVGYLNMADIYNRNSKY